MIYRDQIPSEPAGPELLHAFKLLNRAIWQLSDCEFRVLLAVFDHTCLLDKASVALTVSDIEEWTGLSRPTVSVSAQSLVANGILHRTRDHSKQPFVYRIDMDKLESLGKPLH